MKKLYVPCSKTRFINMDEGYVKYNAYHKVIPASDIETLVPNWQELNNIRTKLYKLGLIGTDNNGIGFGNLSMRLNADEFIISGTGTGTKQELTLHDYCLVKTFDLSRNSIESMGPVQASSESMTHGAVYISNKTVNCVIHIHSRSIFDRMLHNKYPRTPKTATYGTPELALTIAECVKAISKSNPLQVSGAIILPGHEPGIIVFNACPEKAYLLVEELYSRFSC